MCRNMQPVVVLVMHIFLAGDQQVTITTIGCCSSMVVFGLHVMSCHGDRRIMCRLVVMLQRKEAESQDDEWWWLCYANIA